MTYRFSRRALRQLEEIAAHIAVDSPRVANSFLVRVEAIVDLIARRPLIGRPTDFEGVRVFRASPYPYLIFYRVQEDTREVKILQIRHTARKENWKEGH